MELPSTNWVPVARKVPETSYLVTGLKPDRDYKFRVTAETDQAKSEPSLSAVLHRKPGKLIIIIHLNGAARMLQIYARQRETTVLSNDSQQLCQFQNGNFS